ncbi:MAG: DUF1772 domain-containing protein [Sediminibacterium magnilacihabitans]|jgi:hypothetical protein|nr:DUF1772 domain-containing protein [Sediminibacterium magnilacihabitans]PQV59864.1 uncharacterized protein DUF1772 [Sediminibacterium magnilacihabitans]
MQGRNALFQFFLWWAVLGFSIWVGGTLFSMAVVVPMWSESLPKSAVDFFGNTSFNKHIFNFFGPPWMAARSLPLLVALALGWSSPLHRRYLLVPTIVLIIAIIFTLVYVYPINDVLFAQAGGGRPGEEIQSMAHRWIIADRARFAFMLIGYYFLLKAFRLPNPSA